MTTERRGRPVKMQDETQGTDKGADFTADMSADGRWLTYDQLAILRRIDKPSAVKLATRNRWTRRKGNAGQMQVCVPILWFERAEGRRDRYADKSADKTAIGADMSADVRAFETVLSAIQEAHAAEI